MAALADELSETLEDLLRAGLTAVSQSTLERLDVSFKEAARMKLPRLGSILRATNEEIGRFARNEPQSSPRRLAFFVGRAWIQARALKRFIARGDQQALERLLLTPQTTAVAQIRFVTLGAARRVVPGAFASFEFRLRAIDGTGGVAAGEPLVWSCVFPSPSKLDVPPEAFLHLPQRQGFHPAILLEKRVVDAAAIALAAQPSGPRRLSLQAESKLALGAEFHAWDSLLDWNQAQAAVRITQHQPTPLDLDIELQEEVILRDWQPLDPRPGHDEYDVVPIEAGWLPFEIRLDRGPSCAPLRDRIRTFLERQDRPPLYGLAHYESCRIVLQPLAVVENAGIDYLTISTESFSRATLVRAMKFT